MHTIAHLNIFNFIFLFFFKIWFFRNCTLISHFFADVQLVTCFFISHLLHTHFTLVHT